LSEADLAAGLPDVSLTSTPFTKTWLQFGHLVGTSAVPTSSEPQLGHAKTSDFDIFSLSSLENLLHITGG
jgi:hypothetical protein